MGKPLKVNTLIKRGAQVLIEKGVTASSAIESATSLAAKLKVQPDWAGTGETYVDEAVSTKFLDDLLRPYVRASHWSSDTPDQDLSFADPPKDPLGLEALSRLEAELKAQEAAARETARVQALIDGATALRQDVAFEVAKATAPRPVAKTAQPRIVRVIKTA